MRGRGAKEGRKTLGKRVKGGGTEKEREKQR